MSSIATRPSKLLGDVTCTPKKVKVGESVCVEVHGASGAPMQEPNALPISINGVLGTKQYLRFETPGPQTITVIAHRRGALEKASTTLEVEPLPGNARPASLDVFTDPTTAGVLHFAVSHGPPLKRQGTPSRLDPKASPIVTFTTAPRPRRKAASTGSTVTRPMRTRPAGASRLAGGGAQSATYEWDFGDGVKLGTVRPSFSHDYRSKLDERLPYQVFHVTVTVRAPEQRPIVLRRSVTIVSAYAIMRGRGVLQPPVVETDLSARYSRRGGYFARMTVKNPESFDLKLTHRRIEHLTDETESKHPGRPQRPSGGIVVTKPLVTGAVIPVPDDVADVVLKAKSTTSVTVFVPKKDLPDDVTAFAAHYYGTGPNGQRVRVTGHFDVPQHVHPRWLVPAAVSQAIKGLVSRGVIDDAKTIHVKDLRGYELRGNVAPGTFASVTKRSPPQVMMAHKEPPNAVEGDECDPWNLPEVVPDGMFCMPTPETREVMMPPRFMNAKKGDIILSPGNGGLIASVLNAVTPRQPFSHSGIMTRNRDEITHSTASEDRLMFEDFVGTDGIRPDVLKYLWPGVITQTVENAVYGESMVCPETGETYTLAGFASKLGEIASPEIVAPMVVKPDPLVETVELRKKLHEVANFAADQAGKSHYRFFCYTDPTIGLTDKAPAEAKWAAGTFPTVCSSLIWMSIKQAGIPMEGALESSDMDGGAQIAQGTPDGLYLYQADERLAAGEVLYGMLYNMVKLKVGDIGVALTDVADDIGNQVLNTFATDWADEDAKDSEAWRETVDANAVSPQNLMFYDGPHYGHSEPLVFRDARLEQVTVYKWKKVAQTGTLKGTVRFKGEPVSSANVQLAANLFTTTKADGTFELTNVPVGHVLVEAQIVRDSILLSAQVPADIVGNQTTDVVIDLQAPSHLFRRIRIEGWIQTIDYEFAAAADPHTTSNIDGIADLDPGTATHVVKKFDNACDDAVGRLILTIDLQSDDSVRVKTKLRCYNQDEASGDDYSQAEIGSFVVGPDESVSKWIYTDDDNYAEAHFTVVNRTNQS